jgi:hypothetical protein
MRRTGPAAETERPLACARRTFPPPAAPLWRCEGRTRADSWRVSGGRRDPGVGDECVVIIICASGGAARRVSRPPGLPTATRLSSTTRRTETRNGDVSKGRDLPDLKPEDRASRYTTHKTIIYVTRVEPSTTRRAAAPYRRCRRRACMRACRLGAGPHAMGLTASGRHDLNQLARSDSEIVTVIRSRAPPRSRQHVVDALHRRRSRIPHHACMHLAAVPTRPPVVNLVPRSSSCGWGR